MKFETKQLLKNVGITLLIIGVVLGGCALFCAKCGGRI